MHNADQESTTLRSSTLVGQAGEPQGVAGITQANHTPSGGEEVSSSASGIVESPTAMNANSNASPSADGMLLSGHEARAFPGIFSVRTNSLQRDNYNK